MGETAGSQGSLMGDEGKSSGTTVGHLWFLRRIIHIIHCLLHRDNEGFCRGWMSVCSQDVRGFKMSSQERPQAAEKVFPQETLPVVAAVLSGSDLPPASPIHLFYKANSSDISLYLQHYENKFLLLCAISLLYLLYNKHLQSSKILIKKTNSFGL